MKTGRILVVRLGAMGDILHALPAAASLRHSFPEAVLCWAAAPRWRDLLEGNPVVDELIEIDRHSPGGWVRGWRALRRERFDLAVDFQGLWQSALVGALARASRLIGYERAQAREGGAAMLYTETVHAVSSHVVDRNLELAAAAGAPRRVHEFPLPPGRPEGALPAGPFVLASPLAGWVSKQWPLEYYQEVAAGLRQRFGLPLVVNGPPGSERQLRSIAGAEVHLSSVAGLIDATRRAAAVLGVDSGPLHLAAALGKPGAAIYGPTDPARNGPYGGTIAVLRDPAAATSYAREKEIAPSMRAVTPAQVEDALRQALAAAGVAR
jgi:heptosyltransferase-1